MNFNTIKKSKKLGGIYLLISLMLERIVFYSISANFVYTLNSKPLEWSKTNAIGATFLHSGFCFVSTMFGGILADTIIKKSTVVIIGYIFYLAYVGFIIVFSPNKNIIDNKNVFEICRSSHNKSDHVDMFQETCSSIIIPVTFLCAIGSGMIKSVVVSMGSDMALKNWDNPSVFFSIYYWSLNFGSLISFSIITFVQQNCSKFYGFLIPGVLQLLSFIIFLFGMPYYIDVPKSSRSTLNLVFHIYYEAFQKKFNSKYQIITKNINSIIQNEQNDYINDNIQRSLSRQFNNTFDQKQADYPSLNAAFIESSNESSTETSTIVDTTVTESISNISFLDRSKIRFGGNFSEDDVENVRKFSSTLIILVFLIPYWILYFQMETTYFSQALLLKLGFPQTSKYTIPASWLSMIDIVILMILLPVLVRFIYPYLRSKGLYPGNSMRIILGMMLAIISVSLAAVLASIIKNELNLNHTIVQNIGGTFYNSTGITVFAQVPQYLMMGVSESQTIVAGLELVCTRVPSSMQGVTNGLFWFFSGIGSFLGTALLYSFNTNNGEDSHSPVYFCALVAIQLFFLLLFLPCIYNIKRKQKIRAIAVTSSVAK